MPNYKVIDAYSDIFSFHSVNCNRRQMVSSNTKGNYKIMACELTVQKNKLENIFQISS